MVHAPVARQRRLKAHVAQDGVRQVAVLAVGIGKGVRRAAGVLRELILQALEVCTEQFRVGRVRLAPVLHAAVPLGCVGVQVIRVVLHLDEAGVEHFVELVPRDVRIVDALARPLGKIIRVASQKREDDPRRILLQQRQDIDVIIIVSVVKAEDDGLFRQRRAVAHIGDEVRHDDRRVAVVGQPFQVRLKLPRLDGVLAGFIGLHLMIHDDRQQHGIGRGVSLPGGIGRERTEHEQHRQHDGHHALGNRQHLAHSTHLLSLESGLVCTNTPEIMRAPRVFPPRAAHI